MNPPWNDASCEWRRPEERRRVVEDPKFRSMWPKVFTFRCRFGHFGPRARVLPAVMYPWNTDYALSAPMSTLTSLRFDEIQLDPLDRERAHVRRDRQYHVQTVPVLRLVGMLMLAVVVAVHNALVLRAFSSRACATLLALLAAYCAGSWIALRLFYRGDRRPPLSDVFLVADIGVLVAAIYVSGGDRSWLLPVLTVRVADQAYTSFRRVRFFAHATVAAYGLLLVYLVHVEHRHVDARIEVAKIAVLYAVNMYVATTARTAERLRQRSAEAVGIARSLIQELRANEETLQEARARAEEASAFKSAFLANMSHEIRTPLNGILGLTELALDGRLEPDLRDQLETVHDSARGLLRIVNDVLDFSRIEAGRLDFEDAPFDLRDWLAEVLRTTDALTRAGGLELACSVEPAVPDALVGDAGRLRQVLLNLLGNAVKFTPAGRVSVAVSLEGEDERGLALRFAVADTGIGVPPDKRARIFEAFTQGDGSLTRRFGGTGLGLAISRQLVAHMDGRLWLESPPSGGSVFQFTARLRRASGEEAPRVDTSAAQGQRVLVSAETPAAAQRWVKVLDELGCQTTLAELGLPLFTALERCAAWDAPIRLVVLDTDGEDIDVLAVAGKILGEDGSFGGPDVLAAGRSIERGGLAHARELGLTDYLQKPLGDGALAQAALRALAAPRVRPVERAPLVPRQKLAILLAEDNPVNVKVASRLLERWGHEVVVANDGPTALARVAERTFDLALLDVQMPGMTGLEVAERIRAGERASGRPPLPLVALTAHALGTDRERCFAAGMTGYLTKPIDSDLLFETLERRGATGAAPAAGTPAPVAGDEPFDAVLALERAGGDPAFLRELCQLVLNDLETVPPDLRAAVQAGDAPAAESIAHQLKGSFASFAAEPACGAAARLEEAAHDGDLGAMAEQLARLEVELARLSEALGAQLTSG
jgi:signal transduction histidine kinase/DNA-binding response OmpR family regulator/HPt (histidine-containing phosphotransfer) domain-containing protein